MPAILAVDIGTSSMKGGIITLDGTISSWGRIALSDGKTDFTQWDPRRWDKAFAKLAGDLLRNSSEDSIDGVALSGNGPTLVIVDENGETMGNALMWLDGRENRLPDQPSFFLPKAAWFMAHEPKLYEKASAFIPCAEYLNYRLTGELAAVSPSHDFDPRYWTDGGISAYGLDPAKFPALVRIGSTIGHVSSTASAQYGLPAGLPVYGSGSDFLMALVGTGAVVAGRTCDRAGTSEGINHCTETLVSNSALRTLPHAIDGLYNVAGILSSTGRIFEWFRSISGQTELSYDHMLKDIIDLPHDAHRPYFLPSLHLGATWEFSGGIFTELEPETGPREMGRAVVEAIGFSVRDVIHALESSGCDVAELRVSGGQARNDRWSQMKADITGKRILVPTVVDAELVGSACAGFIGSGEFGSLPEAADELVSFSTAFEPDLHQHELFGQSYGTYCEVRDTVIDALAHYRNKAKSVE